MEVTQKRRLRLRRLIVVLVLPYLALVWIGWNVNVLWNRNHLKASILDAGGSILYYDDVATGEWRFPGTDNWQPEASVFRRIAGDKQVLVISVPPKLKREWNELKRAFPEAAIVSRMHPQTQPQRIK